jgi:hypothetical protein
MPQCNETFVNSPLTLVFVPYIIKRAINYL